MWYYFLELVISVILCDVETPGLVCLLDYIQTFLQFYFGLTRTFLNRVEIYIG